VIGLGAARQARSPRVWFRARSRRFRRIIIPRPGTPRDSYNRPLFLDDAGVFSDYRARSAGLRLRLLLGGGVLFVLTTASAARRGGRRGLRSSWLGLSASGSFE